MDKKEDKVLSLIIETSIPFLSEARIQAKARERKTKAVKLTSTQLKFIHYGLDMILLCANEDEEMTDEKYEQITVLKEKFRKLAYD